MNIRWKFITPRSSWQGRFYEHLIGVVKSSSNKAILNRKLSFVELQTILCEICCLVNLIPLTYVSESIEDEALSPNHLVYGRNIVIAPPLNDFMDDVPYLESDALRAEYTRLSSVLRRSEMWVESYLTSLRERHYGNQPITVQNCPLKIGDLVLVDLDDSYHNLWPMGRIVEPFPGSDGQVRSCKIQARGTLYERALTKVVPLELSASESCFAESRVAEPNIPLLQNPTKRAGLAVQANRKVLIGKNLM